MPRKAGSRRFADEDDEDDDLELQALLSKPSLDAIARSKRQIVETAQLGAEVLRNLHGDAEKIRGIQEKQDQVRRYYDEADTWLRKIERAKCSQFACVCLAMGSVIVGIALVIIRIFTKH